MKIEEKDYLKAKETVRLYEEAQKQEKIELDRKIELEYQERVKACDHEYRYTGAKWRSINEQRCIYCGHTIN